MAQNLSHAVMAQRTQARDSLDFFPTPPWATRALCEYVLEDMHGTSVWEPACGSGHMSRALAEYAAHVEESDIAPRGIGRKMDFLTEDSPITPAPAWVITNPPFNRLSDFVRVGLERATRGVAMLCRLQVLEGKGRYEDIFDPYRWYTTIAPFVERVPMEEGCCAPDTSTATAYCWLVIDKARYRMPLIHIPPCRKLLERPDDYDQPDFIAAVRAEKAARKEAKKASSHRIEGA